MFMITYIEASHGAKPFTFSIPLLVRKKRTFRMTKLGCNTPVSGKAHDTVSLVPRFGGSHSDGTKADGYAYSQLIPLSTYNVTLTMKRTSSPKDPHTKETEMRD
jgi:hypothetical protein